MIFLVKVALTVSKAVHRCCRLVADRPHSPGRRPHQHLPVVAAAVNEDVAGSAVGARAAEALRCVALLQGALVLLHGQAVVGEA